MLRHVPAPAVRPLRTRILRPDWPADRLLVFDEDDRPETVHVAAEAGGAVVGVATVYPQAPPPGIFPDAPGAAWQVRGMATAEAVRGTGVGADVLAACLAAVAAGGGRFVWCNARTGAAGFYERAGWTTAGDLFEVAGVGPHVAMGRSVSAGARPS